jgi:hypothetical protein
LKRVYRSEWKIFEKSLKDYFFTGCLVVVDDFFVVAVLLGAGIISQDPV